MLTQDSALAEIQTEPLLYTSLQHYRYASMCLVV
jgi:hypothetical protein